MNFLKQLFDRRIRGFRLVEILAGACLVALVLSVYLTKAAAGRESASIASIDRDIGEQQRQVHVLRAELAHLEQPERLEALSTRYLDLAPVAAKRETAPDSLTEIARRAGAEAR
jgi:hypothetical protein